MFPCILLQVRELIFFISDLWAEYLTMSTLFITMSTWKNNLYHILKYYFLIIFFNLYNTCYHHLCNTCYYSFALPVTGTCWAHPLNLRLFELGLFLYVEWSSLRFAHGCLLLIIWFSAKIFPEETFLTTLAKVITFLETTSQGFFTNFSS